ncbi:MAG: N-acetylmannosaminyltransferase [Peptococcaceae bacterium BICA1-7]|nr:MAG: N-acetylmannosaminyltransferase [Peptococcaceae bacterium BICA1-7]HBV96285.1 glycosyltransferase [Desulfotomaculum sp.]
MRIKLLGAFIDGLTLDQFTERIAFFIERCRSCFIITLNPELLYRSQRERSLMDIVNRADLVTADGVGIVWASRTAGQPVPERVTGIDLMMRLLQSAASHGWRVFFLGSYPGVAESASKRAVELFPGLQVAGSYHGFFSQEQNCQVVELIVGSKTQLLLVALGAPLQEKWIAANLSSLGNIAAVGVGGSLDVLSGNVRRAPRWMVRTNLEWLGRLLMEPSRWKRMLVLPKFMALVLVKYKIGKYLVSK